MGYFIVFMGMFCTSNEKVQITALIVGAMTVIFGYVSNAYIAKQRYKCVNTEKQHFTVE